MQRKRQLWFVLLMAFVLVITACSSSTPAEGPAEGETVAEIDVPDDTWAKIQAQGKLTVCTEAAFKPFEFIEDGEIVGYGKDILTEIVNDMGVELEQLDMPWQSVLPSLDTGRCDFVATSVTVLQERAERYDFTLPNADSSYAALVRQGTIRSIEELDGKIVGTQIASSGEPIVALVDEFLREAGGEGFADVQLYTGFSECYLEVANGRIAACFQGLSLLSVITQEQPGVYDIIECPMCPQQYYAWVVRKGDDALREQIDRTILRLHESGKLKELQEKWFGFTMNVPTEHVEPTTW